jgi:hypothetical protein
MNVWVVQYGYRDDMDGGIDSIWSTRVAAESRRTILEEDIEDNFLFYYVEQFKVDTIPE